MSNLEKLKLTESAEQESTELRARLVTMVELSFVVESGLWKYIHESDLDSVKEYIVHFLLENKTTNFEDVKTAMRCFKFPYLLQDSNMRKLVYGLRAKVTCYADMFEVLEGQGLSDVLALIHDDTGAEDRNVLLNMDLESINMDQADRDVIQALQAIEFIQNPNYGETEATIEALIACNQSLEETEAVVNRYDMAYLEDKTDKEIMDFYRISKRQVSVFRLLIDYIIVDGEIFRFSYISPYNILDSNLEFVEENINICREIFCRNTLDQTDDRFKNIYYALCSGPIETYTESKEFTAFTSKLNIDYSTDEAVELYSTFKDDISDELLSFINNEAYLKLVREKLVHNRSLPILLNEITFILLRVIGDYRLDSNLLNQLFKYIGYLKSYIESLISDDKVDGKEALANVLKLFLISSDSVDLMNGLKKVYNKEQTTSDLIVQIINDAPYDVIDCFDAIKSKTLRACMDTLYESGLRQLHEDLEIEYKNENNIELLNFAGLCIIANKVNLFHELVFTKLESNSSFDFFFIESLMKLYESCAPIYHEYFDKGLITIIEEIDLDFIQMSELLDSISSLPHNPTDRQKLFQDYDFELWKTYIDAYKSNGEDGVIVISLQRN